MYMIIHILLLYTNIINYNIADMCMCVCASLASYIYVLYCPYRTNAAFLPFGWCTLHSVH